MKKLFEVIVFLWTKELIEKIDIYKVKWVNYDFLETYLKFFMLTGMGVITFSNIVLQLFGQTIPAIVWAFFKDVGEMVIITAVFVFAFSWLLKSRPPKKPKNYNR